jgi:hypothetical protein
MPRMRRQLYFAVAITAVTLLYCTQPISAQTPVPVPVNPPMASSQMDRDKENVYERFLEFKRSPNPQQQQYAYPLAKEFLLRWGGDNDVATRDVQRWVTEYDRALHGRELYAAYDAKKYARVFELGRPYVRADPEYFLAFALLTEAGYDNFLSGNTTLNAETADYARKAIALLEAGKVSKPDPFKSLEVGRGYLNFVLGTFVGDEKPVEAADAFRKAVKSDSPFRTEPAAYHRLGVSILRGEFAPLSAEYNQKFGGKPSSTEQTEMLARLTRIVEQAIDAYARAVALSTKPEQQAVREKILVQLTALYKNFHNNSDEGLEELIKTVLSKPLP